MKRVAGRLEGEAGRTRGLRLVATATVVVAVAGYLVLVVAAPTLGPSRYSAFASFWSAVYLAVGAIFGIQQEVARQVSSTHAAESDRRLPVILVSALSAGALIAAVCAVSSPFWAGRVLGQDAVLGTVLICLAAILYSGQSVLTGSLAGLGEWRIYSAVISAEALSRLALVIVAASVFASVASIAVGTVLAMSVWIAIAAGSRARTALLFRSRLTLSASLSRLMQSIGGAAASSLLVTGFPLILSLAVGRDEPAAMGVVILVVTLTRAPVLVPMNAFLGMIVARISAGPARKALPSLRLPALGVTVLAATVALGGLLWGRQLIALAFGRTYLADPWFIAGSALVAGLVGLLSLTGAAALGTGLHRAYLAGWLSAAAASCAVLLVAIPLEPRVVLSLALGPVVGLAIHLTAIYRMGRFESE